MTSRTYLAGICTTTTEEMKEWWASLDDQINREPGVTEENKRVADKFLKGSSLENVELIP